MAHGGGTPTTRMKGGHPGTKQLTQGRVQKKHTRTLPDGNRTPPAAPLADQRALAEGPHVAEGVHRAEEALEPAHLYGVVDLHPVLLAPVPRVEDNGGGETRVAHDDIRAARKLPEWMMRFHYLGLITMPVGAFCAEAQCGMTNITVSWTETRSEVFTMP